AWLIGLIIFSTYLVFSSLTYLSPYLSEVYVMPMTLVSALSIITPNQIPGGNEFAALYMGNAKEGNCMYMAGVEVESGTSVEGYST
ncbi:hypothetical protein ACTPEM_23975, partial [Clostridioides difficile]